MISERMPPLAGILRFLPAGGEATTVSSGEPAALRAVHGQSWPFHAVPLAGLLSIVAAWGASTVYNSYRIPLLLIFAGNLAFAGSMVLEHRSRGPLGGVHVLARLAALIAVLMLGAYGFAFFGVRYGAFSDDAPYLMISAIYLTLPAVLIACALAMRRLAPVRKLAVGLLVLIGMLGGYCAYVIFELLAEVPSILVEHATVASQVHFYNVLMLFYAVLGPVTIAAGLWRARPVKEGS